MLEFGKILKSRTGLNRDATEPTQLLQTQFAEGGDAQEVEEMHLAGIQYNPPVDSRGFVSRVSDAFKILVGINDNVPKETLQPGELLLYSSDSGAIVGKIKLLKSGNLQLNGSGDFAVRYLALETAFNELKTQYNAHNHGGSGTSAPSTADITLAKINTIEFPA